VLVFPRPLRATLRAALVLGLATCAIVIPASPVSAAADMGYVRLAHLSPDTPKVDVYLDALSYHAKELVFDGVGYGTVSGYLSLKPGSYAVSMRGAGADPNSPPVLTTHVNVVAGRAYTVAGVGHHADLGLRIINDDLNTPMSGQSKVRIVQASVKMPLLDVKLADGTEVASGVSFATTTDYELVKSGKWRIDVTPAGGGTSVPLTATLAADNVYSLVILDGKGGLEEHLLVDATRTGVIPIGGVDTGGGGTAISPAVLTPAIGIALVALLGALVLTVRRRPNSHWGRRRARSPGVGEQTW
jgi:hypothetical protein